MALLLVFLLLGSLIQAQIPVAKFSATPTSGTAPLTVTFKDQSTGGKALWKWWGFGDKTGSNLTADTVTHMYEKAGTYTVFLKATNVIGSSISEQRISVNEIIYKFDPNNGNDSMSPWGKSLSSLPSYKTYHLPAKEGYIKIESQYNFIDKSVSLNNDDPTDGNGYYISTLSPDKGHWSWNGSYTPDGENSTEGLIPGSQDHVSVDENGTKHWPSGKGAKLRIYSPYSKMTVIAVVGDNGPAPWTGCQFGASNRVFEALGLPKEYKGLSRVNPNPSAPSMSIYPAKYPVIKYADNPYWVEVSWADQSLPTGLLINGNKSK